MGSPRRVGAIDSKITLAVFVVIAIRSMAIERKDCMVNPYIRKSENH